MTVSKVNPLLSVVVPVYNEDACLEATQARLAEVLGGMGIDYEIVYVDDGSGDGSLELLRGFSREDHRVRYFSLSRNFGHEVATSCGLHHCRGDAAILIDADLQDPPELIPGMLERWREGYEVVAGRRARRDGESWLKRRTSAWFYRLLSRFAEVEIPEGVGDFRLVDRRVIDEFNRFTERNRFVRGMFPWIGYRQHVFEYHRAPRFGGKTKYSYLKLLWLSLEALSGFSMAPLRLAIAVGSVVTVLSMLAVLAILVDKLFLNLELPGYALLTAGMFFLGGTQLMFLGLIGEYIGKIYREVQGRPLYLVREQSPE